MDIYEYKRVIKIYEQQIKNGSKDVCDDSKTSLEIFKITYKWSIEDWNKIRTNDYWINRDQFPANKKNAFLLMWIKEHI